MTIQTTSPRVDLCIRRAELFSAIARRRDAIRRFEAENAADRDAIDRLETEIEALDAIETEGAAARAEVRP